MFRKMLVDLFIWYCEREIYNTPVPKKFDDERMAKFYSSLWEMPGFVQYCIDRETRFVYSQAEKWTEEKRGQRIENMLLYTKAQRAFNKAQETLRREANGNSPKR